MAEWVQISSAWAALTNCEFFPFPHADGNTSVSETNLTNQCYINQNLPSPPLSFNSLVDVWLALSFLLWCHFQSGVKLGIRPVRKSVWLILWNLQHRHSIGLVCISLYEKETDNSWKANEHVSTIWKSHQKYWVNPPCWDKGVILLYEKTCSPFPLQVRQKTAHLFGSHDFNCSYKTGLRTSIGIWKATYSFSSSNEQKH